MKDPLFIFERFSSSSKCLREGGRRDGEITLQPREQNRKESRRLRSQTSQVLVTPFPGLG